MSWDHEETFSLPRRPSLSRCPFCGKSRARPFERHRHKKIAQRGMGAPKPVEENLALSASHICSETRGKKIPGGLGLKPITVEQNSHFCPKNIVWGGGTNGFFRKLSPETTNKTLGKIYLFRNERFIFRQKLCKFSLNLWKFSMIL